MTEPQETPTGTPPLPAREPCGPKNGDPTPIGEAQELLHRWLEETDWDGADPHEGERANAVHAVLGELGCLQRIVAQIAAAGVPVTDCDDGTCGRCRRCNADDAPVREDDASVEALERAVWEKIAVYVLLMHNKAPHSESDKAFDSLNAILHPLIRAAALSRSRPAPKWCQSRKEGCGGAVVAGTDFCEEHQDEARPAGATGDVPKCDEDSHYWMGNAREGDICFCGERAWRRDDTARLEWMVEHDASMGTQGRMEVRLGKDGKPEDVKEFRDTRFARVPCDLLYEWHCYDGATWRDAIDKAMADVPCAKDQTHGCVKSSSIRNDVYDGFHEAKYATLTNHIADLSAQLAAAQRPAPATGEAMRFAELGWNLTSIEAAAEGLERLSAMARSEAALRISTTQDAKNIALAAEAVVAYWDSLWEVQPNDERPTAEFRDIFDAKLGTLRTELEAFASRRPAGTRENRLDT